MSGKQRSQDTENKVLKKSDSAEKTPQQEANPSQMLSRSDMMVLQRTIGNSGLAQMLGQTQSPRANVEVSNSNLVQRVRSRSNAVSGGPAPFAPPQTRGRSNAISGGPAPFAPQTRGRSNAVSGGPAPFAPPQTRGRSNAISGGPAPFVQLEGFPKFVQQLSGKDISAGLINSKLSKTDLLKAATEASLGTAEQAAGLGTTVAGAIRGGEKIATGMSGVSDALGTVGSSISLIFDSVELGKNILQTIKNHGKNDTGENIDLFESGVTVFKDGLDVCNGALSTFTTLLGAFQAASSALPIIGDVISIISAGLDIVLKAIDILKRGWKVIKAIKYRDAIKENWAKNRALVTQWLEDSGATTKEKEEILGKKDKRKGIKSANKLTDFVMKRDEETRLSGHRAKVDPAKSASAIDNLKNYLIDKELASVNKKRVNRQILPLITDGGDILADLLTISGKTTSLITTAAGSAAMGAGAAAGAGISLGTTLASGSIQAAGTGAKGVSWLTRNIKQQARNKNILGGNQDKSSKNKKKNRVYVVEQLLRQAQKLPKFDANDPNVTEQYDRMEMRFEATGVDMEVFAKGDLDTHIKKMYKAIKERE